MEEKNLLSVRGTNVGLGPILPEHQTLFAHARQDPEISLLYSAGFIPPSSLIMTNTLPSAASSQSSGTVTSTVIQPNSPVISFTIYALTPLLPLGQTSLSAIDYRNSTANFSIEIVRKDYWGKGYGTEATRLLLEYAFRFLNMHAISLQVYAFNERAINAYRKAGFQETGRRREAICFSGKRYDIVYMDCLYHEFSAQEYYWYALSTTSA